jgi:HEPN domain-containing protein
MPDATDWRRWVAYAEDDFAVALMLLEERPRHASFQLQQSMEKLLKAALIARGQDPERSHDLVLLVVTLDSTLALDDRIVSAAQLLTLIGARSRYPDRFVEMSAQEGQALLEAARVVRDFAQRFLPT